MITNVVRVDRSPMNPKRWCLQLECGHETWLTQKSKPNVTFVVCATCGEAKLTELHGPPPRIRR